MHPGKRHLNQKFPSVPDPICSDCGTRMRSVKVIKQEQAGQNTSLTCRSDCPECGTRHLGRRVIALNGRHMKFISQSFDPLPRVPAFLLPAALITFPVVLAVVYFVVR